MLSAPDSNAGAKPLVVHFVTGGGSGATRVALDVARHQHAGGQFRVLLLLRRKPAALPASMQEDIRASGLPVAWIENRWPRFRVVAQIAEICARVRPSIFFAHGYSEHLWGRIAARRAGVPRIVHVEHNLEKYSFFRRWQARRLVPHTHATVCVSESVAQCLVERGLGSARTQVILNGTDVSRFAQAGGATPLAGRPNDMVMAARFARQKDHATLLRATRLLIDRGWTGRLFLVGGGKKKWLGESQRLAARLGLGAQVEFAGFCAELPALLHRCRVSVLSTHYEGLPLSLVESMTAGCFVVASDVAGVRDIVRDGENGQLFPAQDAEVLACVLENALKNPAAVQPLVDAAMHDVNGTFSLERMGGQYDALCHALLAAA